jgi:tetratricopeptide (TPR) repeat protein
MRVSGRLLLQSGIVLCLALLPFLPALDNGLVWDDRVLAGPEADRPGIAGSFTRPFVLGGIVTPYYRPAVNVSLLADRALWQGSPRGHHATNILLHGAASLAFFLIAAGLVSAVPALLAAGIFAVHPVHVEAVAFVSGRSDLLAGLFLLLSLAALLAVRDGERHPGRNGALLSVAAAAFFLALISKESALLGPALIAYALHLAARRTSRPAVTAAAGGALFALAFLLYLALRANALAQVRGVASLPALKPNAQLVPPVLLETLRLLVFPHGLSPYYDLKPYPPVLSLGVAALFLALAAALFVAGKRVRWDPAFVLGILLLAVPLVPALPLTSRGGAPLAERFLYLPVAGAALIAAALLERARTRPRLFVAGAAAVACCIAAGGGWTLARTRDWRDDLTLFSRAVARDPDNAVLNSMYGEALLAAGDFARAEPVLLLATRLDPDLADPWQWLARLYRLTGRTERAREVSAYLIGRAPNNADAYFDLGLLELEGRDFPAAERAFLAALRVNPYHLRACINLGNIAFESGRTEEAERYWRQALAIEPANALARQNLEIAAGLRRAAPRPGGRGPGG